MAKPKLVCRGYGSPHGFAAGRLWFACSQCRWSALPPAPPKAPAYQPGYTSVNGDPVSPAPKPQEQA